jgi:hypothetical protein
MTTNYQCRWFTDGPHGRCPTPQQFPGVRSVPPFCAAHLAELEPWIAARAAQRGAQAADWITWAARQAAAAQELPRALLGARGDPSWRRFHDRVQPPALTVTDQEHSEFTAR